MAGSWGLQAKWRIRAALAVAVLAIASAVDAQGTDSDARRLLGGPGGVRSEIEASGLALQLFYHEFLGGRVRGGADPGDGWGHSGSYDLFAQLDFEALANRPGLQLLVHAKGQYDRNLNPEVGALSDPFDDADVFDEGAYVDELWLQQYFLRDRVMVRAGFLEQQALFDRNAFANSEDRQFSATFLDNNPVVPLPNGLGAALVLRPLPWFELAAGIADADNTARHAGFDTAFDGWSSLTQILEATLRAELAGALSGTYRFGVFRDGRRRGVFGAIAGAPLRSASRRGHYGFYLSFDQWLYRERNEDGQGLAFFGRAGFADEDVSPVEWFASLGFQYRGLLPRRDEDVFAAGAYHARVSEKFSEARLGHFDEESGVELYYRFALLPWLEVTPHGQYIASPGGDARVRDAVVALLRVRIAF